MRSLRTIRNIASLALVAVAVLCRGELTRANVAGAAGVMMRSTVIFCMNGPSGCSSASFQCINTLHGRVNPPGCYASVFCNGWELDCGGIAP